MATKALLLAVALATSTLVPSEVAARTERSYGYDAKQIWSSAVRFLRVDEGVTIVDKDADAGYVIFSFVEDKRTFRGSLELVPAQRDGAEVMKVVIHIGDRPEYYEHGMMDRLERKLRADFGTAVRIPVKDKPPTKPSDPEGEKPPTTTK